jgi:hypothetical protein
VSIFVAALILTAANCGNHNVHNTGLLHVFILRCSMDEIHKYHIDRKIPEREDCIFYGSIYISSESGKINFQYWR